MIGCQFMVSQGGGNTGCPRWNPDKYCLLFAITCYFIFVLVRCLLLLDFSYFECLILLRLSKEYTLTRWIINYSFCRKIFSVLDCREDRVL